MVSVTLVAAPPRELAALAALDCTFDWLLDCFGATTTPENELLVVLPELRMETAFPEATVTGAATVTVFCDWWLCCTLELRLLAWEWPELSISHRCQ